MIREVLADRDLAKEAGVIGGVDSPTEAREEMPQTDRLIRSRKYGTFKASEFLTHLRQKRYEREVHPDGFLAVANPAIECPCGGCAIRSDGYICPRCHAAL